MSDFVFNESTYTPPRVAVAVGAFLRAPRELGHSANFTHLFSSEREEQRDYIDGLLVVSIILSFLFFIWAFVLIVLKCKGQEVGCASGLAFESHRPDYEKSETQEGKTQDDIASTSDSSSAESMSVSSNKPLFSKYRGKLAQNSSSDAEQDNIHSKRKIWRCVKRRESKAKMNGTNQRERRTRAAFIVFASITLICTPLTLFLTFGSLKRALVETTSEEIPDSLFLNIQNTVNDMELSLKAINSLSSDALQLVDEVPTDLDIICPLVNMTEFESYLGVDINGIIETIVDQQYRLKDDIKAQFVVQQSFADRIEIVLTAIESYGDETEKYLMILPGFLLAIGSLVVIAMLGVVLAWRERSSARFQRNMTYIVLPLLILSAVTCWIILMTLALTTIIGTDVCLSSSSDGSPDETILEILETVGNGTEGTTYQTAFTYINQCHGPDPMQVIEDLKSETQKFVDNIWRQVSKIDAVGRADVLQKCGNTQDFQEMLTGARDLAMSLTNMRRELSSLSKTMGCNSIHPIYTQASHEIICTETLSASSYGFIMFLIMFLCVMAMISLRSSWLGNIEEEKVYHDETEVAENMVVDEHEEYLAYISRYKHEWQEYEGFEEDGAVSSSPRSEFHDQGRSGYPDCTEYYYNDEEEEYSSRVSESDISTMDSRIMCIEDEQQKETMPHHLDTLCTEKDEEVSCVSSKIPFTTFSSERMRKDSHILTLPPSDLPPPMNPELYIDHDESTENTPDNWDYSNVGSSPQKSRKKRTKSFFSSSATTAYKAQDEGDDDSHHQDHNLDFVPDFDKFLSHDQHSTGEVEVQLNNI